MHMQGSCRNLPPTMNLSLCGKYFVLQINQTFCFLPLLSKSAIVRLGSDGVLILVALNSLSNLGRNPGLAALPPPPPPGKWLGIEGRALGGSGGGRGERGEREHAAGSNPQITC